MVRWSTNIFEVSYNQVDVFLLEVRVRLGRFSWLVRKNDAEAFLEFAFGVCIAIRILQRSFSRRRKWGVITHIHDDFWFWMPIAALE